MHYKEIESQEALIKILSSTSNMSKVAFQSLDFDKINIDDTTFDECLFLGCNLPDHQKLQIDANNYIFPNLDVPYNIYPNSLYSPITLLNDYVIGDPNSYELSLDAVVYKHYMKMGKEPSSIKETLARRLHDHSMTDALYDFLGGFAEDKCVAIMGGHGLLRDNKSYEKIIRISKRLTEQGYLMLSGGGPGAMEATHVGAWLAGHPDSFIEDALVVLKEAPHYKDEFWLDCAFRVVNNIPKGLYDSLGIPTWFYGHEPPTPFASKMAKYFANSVREDGLLAIAKGGIIFAPGSAGTIQEIFQDATQNHYLSFGFSSPMVFMNKNYWIHDKPIYPLLQNMMKEGKYNNLLLSIHDEVDDIIIELEKFNHSSLA